jgi:tetratricopeptide (TPR) repeat protein
MAESGQLAGDQLKTKLQGLVQQWSQGQASLKQIVGLSEEELYAIANQGYYLFLQGKAEPARVLFEGLVAIDPRNAYYYRALGAIYWRLKDGRRAIRQFTYAIRVAPNDVSAYVNRAEVYVASQQFDLARADLQQALDLARPAEQALHSKAGAILKMIGS